MSIYLKLINIFSRCTHIFFLISADVEAGGPKFKPTQNKKYSYCRESIKMRKILSLLYEVIVEQIKNVIKGWYLNLPWRVDKKPIRTFFQKIRGDISPEFTRERSSKKRLWWFSPTCNSDKTGPKFEYANPVSKRRWHLSRHHMVQHSQMEDCIQIPRYIITGCYCELKKLIFPQIPPMLQKLITKKSTKFGLFCSH